jgi:RNA polymerase sigma factor (sigma-70 family)
MRIDVVKNAKYITQVALTIRAEFPTVPLNDIIQELSLLVIQYSDHKNNEDKVGYDPTKGTITTFIKNYPARKLRQTLIYKYVNFTYEGKERIFINQSSLNSPISGDEDGELIDLIEDNNVEDENRIDMANIKDILQSSNLSDKEKDIVNKRFFERKTLEEIAIEYKVTKERIRIIERNALRKLKFNAMLKQLV